MDYSIEDLILAGAIEVAGYDEESEDFLYSFTENAAEIAPEMFSKYLNKVHKAVLYFWELGFIDLEDISSKNPLVVLTDLAFDEDAVAELSEEKQLMLENIKRGLGMI